MASWTKKTFNAMPVTEAPPGPNLRRLQASLSGAVVLALDVSFSMEGQILADAKLGCQRFFAEAMEDGYQVGGILWSRTVEGIAPIEWDGAQALDLIMNAECGPGTDVTPALLAAEEMLMPIPAPDRVVAIFGDGDLGDERLAVETAAKLKSQGIRIITCGLGEVSARQLAVISTEQVAVDKPRVAESDGIVDAIAGMSAGLSRRS